MLWRCDLVPQYEAYKEEIHAAVARVLASGRYILGPEVEMFEREFAEYIGMLHGVGVGNATDGLTLALLALGVGAGDEVITTPFTAIPTNSAIVDAGAKPVFVDVDPATYLMNIEQIPAAITSRTKAIMPVHLFGNVIDIPRLRELAGSIPIVEDASQAHGSTIDGVKAGSMTELSVFSFYPTKNVGGYGDGGIVLTNDEQLARKLRLLRMYGMVDKDHITIHGVNSRLDELQAAILRIKLRHLDEMNDARNVVARRYVEALNPDVFVPQHVEPNVYCNYHVFAARVRERRDELIRFLDEREIQTNIYYPVPLHLQDANAYLGMKRGALPEVEQLAEQAIALPLYPELQPRVQQRVVDAIRDFSEVAV